MRRAAAAVQVVVDHGVRMRCFWANDRTTTGAGEHVLCPLDCIGDGCRCQTLTAAGLEVKPGHTIAPSWTLPARVAPTACRFRLVFEQGSINNLLSLEKEQLRRCDFLFASRAADGWGCNVSAPIAQLSCRRFKAPR